MGFRLENADYSKPYFYMVTIRREKGFPELSQIISDENSHFLAQTEVTRAFVEVIRTFHNTWYCVEPITCFSIMPDHIHLLIKIRDIEKRLSLSRIVWLLSRQLEDVAFKSWAVDRSDGRHLFSLDWHDWIVSREGQLAAFTRYIRENPKRSYLRKSHSEYFRRVNEIDFLGRKWYGYGNAALLDLPVIEPFRCSRKWQEGGPEWNEAINRAARIGPGGAGISTFMSPGEKACGHEIGLAGGRWIVLSPEGFSERWHPSREYECFCAEGRMLFLSLYSAMARDPSRSELYERCHEMGDIVVQALRARG